MDLIENMRIALQQAENAGQMGEVPVGAVLVSAGGEVLAKGCNRTIGAADPTAHAEIVVLRAAARRINNYRLVGAHLFVTVEPCIMCMGAVIHARLQRVVYGAADPKWGGAGSLFDLADDPRLNHRVEVVGGICEPECRELMQSFFRSRRRGTENLDDRRFAFNCGGTPVA
jgi:tRNA(adenine34) deaminase